MSTAAPQKSNLRKLAEYIHDTGHPDEILSILEYLLFSGLADSLRAGGAEAGRKARKRDQP